MTATELAYCDSLIQSKVKFQKSFVDDNEKHDSQLIEEEQRTSTFVSLQKLQNAPVASLERRAAELLGLTVEQMEPLQLVRYREGEFFGLHHDLGVLYEDQSVQLPPRQVWCRRRMATLFVYLNNVEQGGCTYFPECNHLRVQPRRGRAVLFCNIHENGTPNVKTVHAGEAVLGKGNVKYGMNIWACEE
jgi:prolyl 4-hydroxylase